MKALLLLAFASIPTVAPAPCPLVAPTPTITFYDNDITGFDIDIKCPKGYFVTIDHQKGSTVAQALNDLIHTKCEKSESPNTPNGFDSRKMTTPAPK
jgi:hypothetical protein